MPDLFRIFRRRRSPDLAQPDLAAAQAVVHRQNAYQQGTRGRLLREVLPELAETLKTFFDDQDRTDLLAQVDTLVIGRWCICGDDFCQSFFTQHMSHDGNPDVLDYSPAGMLIIHLSDEYITEIETIGRSPLA